MKHTEQVRAAVPRAQASWSRQDNIHLTLKFLGEVSVTRVDDVSDAAERAAKEFSPIKISVEQTGVFPRHGPPRVLWIGVYDDSGCLASLNSRLEDECAAKGFARQERPFHPHLTLARLRKPQGARDLAEKHKAIHFEPVEVVVSELLVIRSELSSEGSKYSMISRHPLGT